jgi:hypothetical protein
MGMPTEAELREALAEAARMREQGEERHHLAKVLLNLEYRNRQLERVLEAAELFLLSGMAVQEHERLERAIEAARAAVRRTGAAEDSRFGLE